MQLLLCALDALFCCLVVALALEGLRRIRPLRRPLLSLLMYLAATGGFGSLDSVLLNASVSAATLTFHSALLAAGWVGRHPLRVVLQVIALSSPTSTTPYRGSPQ